MAKMSDGTVRGNSRKVRAGRAALWQIAICLAALLSAPGRAAAQDWFRTGTGLGVQKARVAVADFTARSGEAKPLSDTFTSVLRSDLDYSGILELVSKSFQPAESPSTPHELRMQSWSDPPANARLVAFGNLSVSGSSLAVEAWLYDLANTAQPAVLGKVYRGEATDPQAREFAHQFADEIVARLSGGLPGIASTKIAFVSLRSGNKEIWEMDYDGSNQHQLTSLRSIALTPRWSPDATRIAFTCFAAPPGGPVSAQICIYSTVTNKLLAFPRWRGTNETPAWSPDGTKIMFMSSMYGDPELFVVDTNGGHAKRITYSAGADTSPAYNPKTGDQVIFVSDRGGLPQLFVMNADGTNASKIDLPDKGYVVDPAWSPNGQLVAFSWRRPNGNYDLYAMDVATHQLVELTRDAGRNERPSWAPDGRHLVFESTRTGTRQIWSMLADGSQLRQLTTQGVNESPNWSPK
jgi:TolB protein